MEAFSISSELLPFGLPVLGLLSVAPLYVATYRLRSGGEAFAVWALQALTVHLVSSWWLANFQDYAIFTLGASAAGTAVEAGLCGMIAYILPQHLGAADALAENGGRRPYLVAVRLLWFAAGFTFWEWIKSTGFLAYPWGTLSMAAYRWKVLVQIADITGVWGITFLFASVSALVGEGALLLGRGTMVQSESVARGYACCARGVAALFALSLCYGAWHYYIPVQPVKHIRTVAIQQNQDTWEGSESQSVGISKRLTESQLALMRDAGMEPDLVLWSEGVLQRPFPEFLAAYTRGTGDEEGLTPFIRRMDVPFIIGGTTTANAYKRHFSNSALFFDKDGEYAGFYAKAHLVPFAEALPYPDSPLVQNLMRKLVGFSSGWQPGSQYVLFTVPISDLSLYDTPLEYRDEKYVTVRLDENGRADAESSRRFIQNTDPNPDAFVTFSVPICFEDAFNDVCSELHRMGSEVFMNITNDSWSLSASSEYQHFIVASYRAIEYRTTLVRCANAGYSAVVDATGRVIDDLPVFTQGAMATDVPVYPHVTTVYAALGDWFAYLLFAYMAAVIAVLFARRMWPRRPAWLMPGRARNEEPPAVPTAPSTAAKAAVPPATAGTSVTTTSITALAEPATPPTTGTTGATSSAEKASTTQAEKATTATGTKKAAATAKKPRTAGSAEQTTAARQRRTAKTQGATDSANATGEKTATARRRTTSTASAAGSEKEASTTQAEKATTATGTKKTAATTAKPRTADSAEKTSVTRRRRTAKAESATDSATETGEKATATRRRTTSTASTAGSAEKATVTRQRRPAKTDGAADSANATGEKTATTRRRTTSTTSAAGSAEKATVTRQRRTTKTESAAGSAEKAAGKTARKSTKTDGSTARTGTDTQKKQ